MKRKAKTRDPKLESRPPVQTKARLVRSADSDSFVYRGLRKWGGDAGHWHFSLDVRADSWSHVPHNYVVRQEYVRSTPEYCRVSFSRLLPVRRVRTPAQDTGLRGPAGIPD